MRNLEEIKADYEAALRVESFRDNIGQCPANIFIYFGESERFKGELLCALTDAIPLDRLELICNAERDGRVVVLNENSQIKAIRALYSLLYDVCEAVKKRDISFARYPRYVCNTVGMDDAPIINAFNRICDEHDEAIYTAFKSLELTESAAKSALEQEENHGR